MDEPFASPLGASSPWGPTLCVLGLLGLVTAFWVHVVRRKPTLFSKDAEATSRSLSHWERLSVHLIGYDAWAVAYGAVIWRGPVENYLDTHLAFERGWPVYPAWEWIYVSVYFVPFLMPWLAPDRSTLRRYARHFGWVCLISVALYVVLPCGCPPRPFTPNSLSGRLLAWETERADFAAAAFPSFHVMWALLCAELLSARGRRWSLVASGWATAVIISCVATGAHALLDVVASLVIFAAVARGFPLVRAASVPRQASAG